MSTAFGLNNNNMAMVVVDNSCLQANSQPKSRGLVWGSTAAWRCSTFINVNAELCQILCMVTIEIVIKMRVTISCRYALSRLVRRFWFFLVVFAMCRYSLRFRKFSSCWKCVVKNETVPKCCPTVAEEMYRLLSIKWFKLLKFHCRRAHFGVAYLIQEFNNTSCSTI